MAKRKAVIFDIDGTLAEMSPDRANREYEKVHLDTPIVETFKILSNYYNYVLNTFGKKGKDKIIFITGRKELCREQTVKWLGKYYYTVMPISCFTDCLASCSDDIDYHFGKNYDLHMRSNNDHRPDVELKKEIYEKHIKDQYEVLAVFEDRPRVARMWRDEGLLVFQVGAKDEF